MLLVPFDRTLGPVDPDVQVVLVTVGDLGGVENAFGTTLVADKDIAVVIQRPTRNEG